jgi:inosine/xanthosine triphosphatase
MIVIIASTRQPKVNGVKRAVKKVCRQFHVPLDEIEYKTVQVESGVSDTPKSIEELMQGARQRAEAVFKKSSTERVLSAGVEGGLFRSEKKVFLQSWTCVFDGKDFFYGSSGAIEIPEVLSAAVMERGEDLGKVIDGFAEKSDVRSNQGTFGILSDDLITREDSFETATVFALMPVFNGKMYHRQ